MQLLPDGTWQYSPTDLTRYLDGDFAAWCERRLAERRRGTRDLGQAAGSLEPDEENPELKLAAAKGYEHEARYLDSLRLTEPGLVELTRDHPWTDTLAAMRAGAPIIYQGPLEHGAWRGHPDFLVRVPGTSALGDYHYEPWDTKLARSPKPEFLVQLSAYAGLLESMQGTRPRKLVIVLGNNEQAEFPTDDYFFHYLRARDAFLDFQADWDPARMPHPGLDRSTGRWSEAARTIMEASDHLSQVANITRSQIGRLEAGGIATMAALAASAGDLPDIARPVGLRLRAQADLQRRSRGVHPPLWQLQPLSPDEPRRGLALLPPRSALDVFFDMEGFPFADRGLEYLFGAAVPEPGAPGFHDWWAHDDDEERVAFEGFIDFVAERRRRDPAMHVYHYASYERSALCRLMGKYGTRENEVDDLLRHGVLVDLYTVVRQALIVGTPSYSLKDIEHLYLPPREGVVTSAGGSIVEYQRWLDSGEPPEWDRSPVLRGIRDYNKVDCESTAQLRDWLTEQQGEARVPYLPPPGDDSASEAENTDRLPHPAAVLAAALLQRVADGPEPDPERRRVTQLIAGLLEYHRREQKPMWWRMYDRLDMSEDERHADPDCLAGLVRTATAPVPEKLSLIHEYLFDPEQETTLAAGSKCRTVGGDPKLLDVRSLDRASGRLTFKLGRKRTPPERLSLIPNEGVGAEVIEKAVLRFGEAWADGTGGGAVEDLLFRRPPRIRDHAAGSLIDGSGDLLPQVIDIAGRMDRTTLCIQGPPGTGKTFTAAAVIADLLRRGKRIGITANSHKVILNLMKAVVKARAGGAEVPMYKAGGDDDSLTDDGPIEGITSGEVAGVLGSGAVLVGGTAWLFSREELAGRFDYLFVDEAGQVPLANAVAIGGAATNLVLIGDPMQLGQPTQGTHPGDSRLSCLEYALHGRDTIPPELGIFLEHSWRMHPDICRFVSAMFYEGRLASREHTARRRIAGGGPAALIARETGIVFLPVSHDGCGQASDEEICTIERIVTELRTRHVVDEAGQSRPLTLDDILFVAPFNRQVRQLRARLGDRARAGSVDRFQGQEAPVVIVSLCASTLEDAPRGAGFLLDRNRLNVAVSRAQSLAIVVGSPALLEARCKSIAEMRLVNVLCRLVRESTTSAP